MNLGTPKSASSGTIAIPNMRPCAVTTTIEGKYHHCWELLEISLAKLESKHTCHLPVQPLMAEFLSSAKVFFASSTLKIACSFSTDQFWRSSRRGPLCLFSGSLFDLRTGLICAKLAIKARVANPNVARFKSCLPLTTGSYFVVVSNNQLIRSMQWTAYTWYWQTKTIEWRTEANDIAGYKNLWAPGYITNLLAHL